MTIGHRTNAIYQDVVAGALDLEIDALTRAGQRFADRSLARAFGGDAQVVHELRRLRDLNDVADHFELGAYHNALLHAVVPDQIEAMNAAHDGGELIAFCGGRYLVRAIDVEAFVDVFFEDTDFALPKDRVNEFGAGEKSILGLDDAVFGVANALAPHPDELRPRRGSADAVGEIVEITATEEERLRDRHRVAPAGVWEEIAAIGALYRRGEVFPYWPAWLGDA